MIGYYGKPTWNPHELVIVSFKLFIEWETDISNLGMVYVYHIKQ